MGSIRPGAELNKAVHKVPVDCLKVVEIFVSLNGMAVEGVVRVESPMGNGKYINQGSPEKHNQWIYI